MQQNTPQQPTNHIFHVNPAIERALNVLPNVTSGAASAINSDHASHFFEARDKNPSFLNKRRWGIAEQVYYMYKTLRSRSSSTLVSWNNHLPKKIYAMQQRSSPLAQITSKHIYMSLACSSCTWKFKICAEIHKCLASVNSRLLSLHDRDAHSFMKTQPASKRHGSPRTYERCARQ